MDSLRAAWNARTSSERNTLLVGGVSVAVLLFYGFLWEPLRLDHKRLRETLPQLRAQAAELAGNAAEARRLLGIARTGQRDSNPRIAVETSAAEAGLKRSIKNVAEVSGGRLQLTLDAVPYDTFVRWIGTLAATAGIAVESVEVRPGPASGTVLVDSLVLRGAGAS